MISLLNRSQRISARGIYIPLGLLNNARSGGNFSCTDDTVSWPVSVDVLYFKPL